VKYSQAQPGRIFVIRLEDGEILHEVLEKFAADRGVERAYLIAVGGAGTGSALVVGPEDPEARPVPPLTRILDGVHEIAGVGTLFPGADGRPLLHIHLACGREGKTVTGCGRTGVKVWQVAEVIMVELTGTDARRKLDPGTGFELLQPGG
jgi:predicted DNA-binding protein with PD1-like motif